MAKGSMSGRAASGAFFVGMSQLIRMVLTIVSTTLVSRILTPDDYGVIAMVAPVTAFLITFQDLGLSQATIQSRETSHGVSRGLFWLNVLASVILSLLLLVASPLIGWFYHDVRAAYVAAASSGATLLTGLGVQHSALLTRELRFAVLSWIDIASGVCSFIVTLVVAVLTKSYWALWLGSFLGTAMWVIMLWRYERWRPGWTISLAGTRSMAKFGGGLTGFNLVNFLSRNLDNVLIARFAGSVQLGLYDRSYKLMMLPIQNLNAPISRVLLPVLGRLRDEPERYRSSFLSTVRAVLFVSVPGILVAAATSDRLVPFLLGARWKAAGAIFFWLSLAGLAQPLGNMTGWLFITSGRTLAMARWGVVTAITSIAGFIIGLRWGATGVAMSVFITTVARTPFQFIYATRGTAVRTGDLYLALAESSAGAALAWIAISQLPPTLSTGALIGSALVLSYLIAVGTHGMTPAGRDLLKRMFHLGIHILSRAIRQLQGAQRVRTAE